MENINYKNDETYDNDEMAKHAGYEEDDEHGTNVKYEN